MLNIKKVTASMQSVVPQRTRSQQVVFMLARLLIFFGSLGLLGTFFTAIGCGNGREDRSAQVDQDPDAPLQLSKQQFEDILKQGGLELCQADQPFSSAEAKSRFLNKTANLILAGFDTQGLNAEQKAVLQARTEELLAPGTENPRSIFILEDWQIIGWRCDIEGMTLAKGRELERWAEEHQDKANLPQTRRAILKLIEIIRTDIPARVLQPPEAGDAGSDEGEGGLPEATPSRPERREAHGKARTAKRREPVREKIQRPDSPETPQLPPLPPRSFIIIPYLFTLPKQDVLMSSLLCQWLFTKPLSK